MFPEIIFKKPFKAGYNDNFVKMLKAISLHNGDSFLLDPATANQYNQIAASNMMKERVFANVVEHLNSFGIKEVAALKGVALMQHIYKDYPGIRAMCDIDVLLKPADYKKLIELVRAKKFPNSDSAKIRAFHSLRQMELDLRFSNILVEFHDRLSQIRHFNINWNDLFAQSETVKIYNKNVKIPSLEWTLVVYLIHNYSCPKIFECLSYRYIAEFYFLYKNADAKKTRELCGRYNIAHLLDLMLYLVDCTIENASENVPSMIPHWYKLITPSKKNNQVFEFCGTDNELFKNIYKNYYLNFITRKILIYPAIKIRNFAEKLIGAQGQN